MFVRIWKFRVKKGLQTDFEKAYGPDGSWADLFKRAEGFIGTELLRSYSEEATYVTIDRWASKADFGSFLSQFAIDYEQLDNAFKPLTQAEVEVGSFEQLS